MSRERKNRKNAINIPSLINRFEKNTKLLKDIILVNAIVYFALSEMEESREKSIVISYTKYLSCQNMYLLLL